MREFAKVSLGLYSSPSQVDRSSPLPTPFHECHFGSNMKSVLFLLNHAVSIPIAAAILPLPPPTPGGWHWSFSTHTGYNTANFFKKSAIWHLNSKVKYWKQKAQTCPPSEELFPAEAAAESSREDVPDRMTWISFCDCKNTALKSFWISKRTPPQLTRRSFSLQFQRGGALSMACCHS